MLKEKVREEDLKTVNTALLRSFHEKVTGIEQYLQSVVSLREVYTRNNSMFKVLRKMQ